MKIAYIGLDLFYPALKKLHSLGLEIVEIFTCEVDNVCEFNTEITGFAKENNIPLQPARITREDINRLIDKGCEWAICGGYYFKIPHDTALPIVNIHPSLLPSGRGSWPMAQSILWKHEKSGVTIHKIAEGFDTGDILLQREFGLSENETHQTFMEKANCTLVGMLEELCQDFDVLYKNAMPQQGGEYWEAPTEEDYTVTPDMTVEEADLILRAFYGYECIYDDGHSKKTIIGYRAFEGGCDGELKLKNGYLKRT